MKTIILIALLCFSLTNAIKSRKLRSIGNCETGGAPIYQAGLSDDDKAQILNIHNQLRSTIASGYSPGQPPAANMKALQWDDSLAHNAQIWAQNCEFFHPSPTQRNQGTPFDYVGQNIAEMMQSNFEPQGNWEGLIGLWYNEVNIYQGGSAPVDSFSFDEATGHYTQLAWAGTSSLGCGYVEFNSEGWYRDFLVCNYGPGGNIQGQPMYEEGEFDPSECSDGVNTEYEDLCNP